MIKITLHRLLRSTSFRIGAAIILVWVLAACFGGLVVPRDPFHVSPAAALQPPNISNWFGTDALGRDVFARVIVGSRDILLVSSLAAIIGTVLGTAIGLVSGYVKGAVDEVLSRIGEAVIAIPTVIFAMLLIAGLGRSTWTLIAVVSLGFSWVVARTIRGAVLGERNRDYVRAAEARGESRAAIMVRELLPNVVPVIIVELTVRMTFAVFAVANLSFLGFGVQPPSPDWGLQVADGYGLLAAGYWWPALFPTLAIASLVVSVYLVADELNEVMSGRKEVARVMSDPEGQA